MGPPIRVFASLILTLVVMPPAYAEESTAEMLLTPVNPPSGLPPYPPGTSIVGQEIRLPRGGLRVWVEWRIRNWDPDGNGTPRVRIYEAQLDWKGFRGEYAVPPGNVDLHPAFERCEGEDLAEQASCVARLGGGHCVGPDSQPMAGCVFDYCCMPAYLDRTRPDVIGSEFVEFELYALAAPFFNWRFAGIQKEAHSVIDQGLTYYARTLVIEVPQGAKGKYSIGFDYCTDGSPCYEGNTFLADDSLPYGLIYLAAVRNAVINIGIGKCCSAMGSDTTSCEDGVTLDECEALPATRAFLLGEECSGDIDADCGDIRGACCDHKVFDEPCREDSLVMDCACPGCEWSPKSTCDELDCRRASIPTLSDWGLITFTLLLLIGAKVAFGRRSQPIGGV